mgnify:CR=1 FL=1
MIELTNIFRINAVKIFLSIIIRDPDSYQDLANKNKRLN